MYFKLSNSLIISFLFLFLSACSDSANEEKLVNLFTSASLDIISIDFPANSTETLMSTNAFVDYTIEGLKSNTVDTVPVTENIIWSISSGAASTINQNGRLSSGNVAELVTITAQFGHLSQTLDVTISSAKFDQVVKLNESTVQINMCQDKTIIPIGRYLNEDGSEEIRPVDSSVINTISWDITNQEDNTASQRLLVNTQNNITRLQAFENGDVIIRATATSLATGNVTTSIDLNQKIDNNLTALKLCPASTTDLTNCSMNNVDIVVNNSVAIKAIGSYQATDGSSYNENISANSKWGIDNTSIATLAFSADRSQMVVSGLLVNTTAILSSACGKIQQSITDDELNTGVILSTPVSCDTNCLLATAAIPIVDEAVISLTVKANNINVNNNIETTLTTRPLKITLNVTAVYSNNADRDVTSESDIIYSNQTPSIITQVTGTPNEFNVNTSGTARIQIIYAGQLFNVIIKIPI